MKQWWLIFSAVLAAIAISIFTVRILMSADARAERTRIEKAEREQTTATQWEDAASIKCALLRAAVDEAIRAEENGTFGDYARSNWDIVAAKIGEAQTILRSAPPKARTDDLAAAILAARQAKEDSHWGHR